MALVEQTVFGETRDKVATAIARIKEFEPPEGYFLAFSGGKDSAAIFELATMSGVKFDAHYHVTTVDPPELVLHIKREYPSVKFDFPRFTMWELIVKKGMPPTRVARYCCEYLKETGGDGRFVVTGIRWEESVARSKRRLVERCDKGKGRTHLHPIIDWSAAEVWEFLKMRGVKSCSLYNEGFSRLGCIACPFQGEKQRRAALERWPKYKLLYIRAFDKMNDRLKKRRLDIRWASGEDVLEWWLTGRSEIESGKGDENQERLFD